MNMIKTITQASLLNAALGVSVLLIAACAADATKDPGVARVRADLTAVQSDPHLANRAPVAMQNAEQAVRTAEMPSDDSTLTAHRVYIADRKVQTTKSLAQAQYAVDQRKALSEQSDQVRLDARTREADAATNKNQDLTNKNQDLLAELADLKARKTDHGIEMTLGDVLFSSGRSELKAGSAANLDKLATALNAAPDRRVTIDGYTDSQGGDDMNMALSRQRADAVSSYLIGRGVDSSRVTASGKGESLPVADNETATGRQLNRRVVVTIQDAPQ